MDKRLARSRAQERRGARVHGGRQTKNSGSTYRQKGDVRVGREYVIEYKRTDRGSITIQDSVLRKLFTEACLAGRDPVLGIELRGKNYCLVPEDDYVALRERARGQ